MSRTAPKHLLRPGEVEPAELAEARGGRRWPRRLLIAANVVCLFGLLVMASAYGYVRYRLGEIRTAKCPSCTSTQTTGVTVPVSGGLQAENILLIGNETRIGLTPAEQRQYGSSLIYNGTLADIMMILHLDPVDDTASILSIPRDLFAPMPAGSPVGAYQKMDAALNDGAAGPNNLVKAVQDDLGIPINHFIELNFNGFINTVNALGGINVYFPRPVWDAESLLYISTKGCHHLDGVEALALVRARHLQYEPAGVNESRYDWPYDPQSDLARIVRTHTFMKIVAEAAKSQGLTDPIRANDFIGAVISQMTVDPALKAQLLTLVEHYRHLNPNAVAESTLPVTGVGNYYYPGAGTQDVVFPVQPADNRVISAWDRQALADPAKPLAVRVVSITGSYYAALSAGEALSRAGFHVVSESAGEVPASITETLVMYHPGQRAEGVDVMGHLSGSVIMQLDPSLPPGTVEVDLGSSVAITGAGAPATTTSGLPSTPRTTTTTSRAGSTAKPVAPTTAAPTPGGTQPTSSADLQQPWDPRSC